VKQVIGGFQGNNHAAAKEFVAMGLANSDDFTKTKTGEIKGFKPGRHVHGFELAQSDPDLWVYKYLLPALNGHGFTTEDAQIGQIRRMFPAGTAADLVAKLVTQRESFSNHALLYGQAKGTDAALGLNQQDAFVALNSLTTSLESFAGVVTSPIMEKAAGVMSGIASLIGQTGAGLQKLGADHPLAAELGGGAALAGGAYLGTKWTYNLATGFLGGFGLKGSAVALDGAAASLTAAAEALGGAGVAQKAAKAAEAAGTAAPAAAASIWARGAIAIPLVGAAGVLGLGAYQLHEAAVENEGKSIGERRGRMSEVYRKVFNEERAALGLPQIGQDSGKPVTAELHGQAEVKGEAKVTITIPGLGDRDVRVPLRGTMNANGPGSLGVSSPDAGAPGHGLGHR
jgi:hypothetical protein